jgi:syntaxin-binding protein 1
MAAEQLIYLQDHQAGKLDQSVFPFVKDAPLPTSPIASARPTPTPTTSLRSQKPAWHRAQRPGGAVEIRQRILVFVLGGMAYSEMREAYELSTSLNKDVFIGKESILLVKEAIRQVVSQVLRILSRLRVLSTI